MRKLPLLTAPFVLAAVAAPALGSEARGNEQARAGGTGVTSEAVVRPSSAKRRSSSSRKLARGSRYLIPKIDRHQRATWYWQTVMGKPRTPSARSARASRAKAYRKWVLRVWTRRHVRARRQAMNPPHKTAWLCIRRYEGSWTDGGGPYYGGLQMDYGFMRTYGSFLLRRKGTADNWTPLEQMWVAERALRAGRGFYPWPNAARLCGLI
jgi:hypothetical protein